MTKFPQSTHRKQDELIQKVESYSFYMLIYVKQNTLRKTKINFYYISEPF